MGNGRILDFQGAKRVSHADVAGAPDCLTVCMRISGGEHGKSENPLVIFRNPYRHYPIAGIPDDIECVSYKSSPKGWMSSRMFSDYFFNQNVLIPLSGGRMRKSWIHSCRIHNDTLELRILFN